MADHGRSLAAWLYRQLLWLLPRHVRDEDGEQMALAFEDLLSDQPSLARRLATSVHMVAALGAVATVEHFETLKTSTTSRGLAAIWDGVRLDSTFLLRTFRRDAGLATLMILILGLGIGASATVFSVVNTLLFKPLPFAEPDRLVWISNGAWGRGQQLSALTVQVGYVQDLAAQSRTLSGVVGYHLFDREGDNTLSGDGEPERITRLRVSPGFFPLLGVPMLHGRTFDALEEAQDGPRATILAHGFWKRRFGSDPAVVGNSLTINGEPVTVVGVAPASFDFPAVFAPGNAVDFIIPFPLSEQTNRQGNTLGLIARLADGIDVATAQHETTTLVERMDHSSRNGFEPWLVPLRTRVSGTLQSATVVISAAVLLMMVVVCANLASLLLARGASRKRELAIRAAVGADAGRLRRQVLTESTLMAATGGTLGLALAFVATRTLSGMNLGIPLLHTVGIDGAVFAFAALCTLLTGLLFGALPAARLSDALPEQVLSAGGRAGSSGKRTIATRSALVVAEVALTSVLLVCATLLGRSLVELLQTDLGFRPAQVYAVRVDPRPRPATSEERVAYLDAMLAEIRETPGVESAGLTDVLPVGFNRRWDALPTEAPDAQPVYPFVRIVSEGYMDAMGMRVVDGRSLTATDNSDANLVAVINEALAERLWPGMDPIGRSLRTSGSEYEVVGVTRGMRYLSPDQAPGPELFLSLRQVPDFRAAHLIVRSSRREADVEAGILGTLRRFDRNLPVTGLTPVQSIIEGAIAVRRFIVSLLVGFAAFTLLLASLGLYGVIAHSVTRRRKEIGIRLALGEAPSQVRTRVVSETLRLAGMGIVVGMTIAFVASRTLRSLVYGVSPTDPVTFMVVPVILFGVSWAAGLVPALKASRVDPAEVLAADG